MKRFKWEYIGSFKYKGQFFSQVTITKRMSSTNRDLFDWDFYNSLNKLCINVNRWIRKVN